MFFSWFLFLGWCFVLLVCWLSTGFQFCFVVKLLVTMDWKVFLLVACVQLCLGACLSSKLEAKALRCISKLWFFISIVLLRQFRFAYCILLWKRGNCFLQFCDVWRIFLFRSQTVQSWLCQRNFCPRACFSDFSLKELKIECVRS